MVRPLSSILFFVIFFHWDCTQSTLHTALRLYHVIFNTALVYFVASLSSLFFYFSYSDKCPIGWYQQQPGEGFCLQCFPGRYGTKPGQAMCLPCKVGLYSQRVERTTACDTCPRGRSSNEGSAQCSECSYGKYVTPSLSVPSTQSNSSSESNQNTSSSSFNSSRSSSNDEDNSSKLSTCTLCPSGWSQDETDQDSCKQCGLATAEKGESALIGAVFCSVCDLGTFQSPPSTLCLPCGIGTFADGKGSKSCRLCPIDTFGTIVGSTSKSECTTCPEGRTTGGALGSHNVQDCICQRELFYSQPIVLEEDVSTTSATPALFDNVCVPCPAPANCSMHDGILLTELSTKPTFWRSSSTSIYFHACTKYPKDCSGGSVALHSQCRTGHTGTLCAVCLAGHARQGMEAQCLPCPGGQVGGAGSILGLGVGFMGCICICCILYFTSKSSQKSSVSTTKDAIKDQGKDTVSEASGSIDLDISNGSTDSSALSNLAGRIKILLGFIQVFQSMDTTFSVPWGADFAAFLNFPLFKLVDIDLLAVLGDLGPCAFSYGYFDRFTSHMLVLPIVGIFALLACGISLLLRKVIPACSRRFDAKTARERCVTFIVFVVFLLYPGYTVKIFQMFGCREIDPGMYYLTADISVQCFADEWNMYAGFAVAAMVVYVLGIPLTTLLILRRNRKALFDVAHPHNRAMTASYGSLYTQYEASFYMWECVELVKKMLLT